MEEAHRGRGRPDPIMAVGCAGGWRGLVARRLESPVVEEGGGDGGGAVLRGMGGCGAP